MSPPTLANIRRFVQKEKARFASLMYPQTGHWDSPGPNTPCPNPAARPQEVVCRLPGRRALSGHCPGTRAGQAPRGAWPGRGARTSRWLLSWSRGEPGVCAGHWCPAPAEAPTHLPAPARRLFSRGLRILENEGRERLAWAGRDRGKTESPTLSPAGP